MPNQLCILKKGSAQCKSSVMLAALNTNGITKIKAKKSRDHTELMLKSLNLPISIIKNFDLISIKGRKILNQLIIRFLQILVQVHFIVLVLSNNSKITIKNVNINPLELDF